MKAIVMAGGEGTRLRPLTVNCPKPMVKLIDKPVLEHIVSLLKRNGITDICFTLRYLPEAITRYFGNGRSFGVSIESRIEEEPLGTAGSVKACSDFIGKEDFLVISGDAVCNFDLQACMEFHREKKADVTLVLYSHENPLEYGLVVTGKNGNIERFIEKPSWDMVFTNNINTGIYIISNHILKEIPENQNFDFGRDLFPKLVKEGKKLYGVGAEGYWCDIGSCEAYLSCCIEALNGIEGVSFSAPEVRPGIYSLSALPGELPYFEAPVYIGQNVTLEPGAHIGPNVILGDNSTVACGASVRDSVVDGAVIAQNAVVYGAVIGRGCAIGKNAAVGESSVIGEKTIVGDGATIAPRIKIWPEREIPNGAKIADNIVSGMLRGDITFGAGSEITGEWGVSITPETCIALGAACAKLGRVGIGHCGAAASKTAAAALSCGVLAAGGSSLEFDSGFEACAAFAAAHFKLPVTVFFKQEGNSIRLSFFGENGTPLKREHQRKIEAAAGGDFPRANAQNVGISSAVTGVFEAYTAAAAGATFCAPKAGFPVAVNGKGAENRALRAALTEAGFQVVEKQNNTPSFQVLAGGFSISAEDENGRPIDREQMLVLTALAEFENGCGKIAVPFGAPAALDILASALGTKVLRIGRDGEEAQELFLKQPFLRDGIFSAVRICSALAQKGETLSSLRARMPRFSSVTREILLNCDRGAAMKKMAAACPEMAMEFSEGLRLSTDRGWVHISPCHDRPALRIKSEGENAEIAEQLCADFERRARDAGIKMQ